MNENKKILLILAGGALVIVLLGLTFNNRFLPKYQEDANNPPTEDGVSQDFTTHTADMQKTQVTINDYQLIAAVADSRETKDEGLGGVNQMGDSDGMLFVFDPPNEPTFWMKGMIIAIDIIWIADNKIVGIEKNVQPPPADTSDDDLIRYPAPQAIDYVLEVRGGLSDTQAFVVGNSVTISNVI